ncbi:hypothetical protein Sango_3112500 [Sesamum angolense]|uniref:Reverse transcriptase zinc-binding domain-containing protein n=1 Tax=Sesamum angolense TaxID=2727404 RepID=A0AAE1VYW4_9LAMI|nr:hypothetical protein Sango_3112500 [Sesamum angolense]
MTRSNGISLVPYYILFGFRDILLVGIEECVTTPMFSFASMGTLTGSSRVPGGCDWGILCPRFLFVLIMEVLQLMLQQLIDQNEGFSFHWRCKEIGLFQLCFVDDLLLFCKADVASVGYFGMDLRIRQTLRTSCHPQKSQLILSRLAAIDFGLPTPSPKIDSRIKGLDSIQLSFTGRLQLIKSGALCSLNVYWGYGLILPKGSYEQLRKGCVISCGKETAVDIQVAWWLLVGGNFFDYDQHFFPTLNLRLTIHTAVTLFFGAGVEFTTTVAYGIFRTPGPKVGWYPLLSGPCMIPRFSFVLWLAILGKLSTMDKPWLSHLGEVCVVVRAEVETHEHLFFGADTLGGHPRLERGSCLTGRTVLMRERILHGLQ